ncbi:MAG: ACP synthase, partial [Acinetobacter sp.]|nr:ACP synthase [Acinetobacter sp.]
AILKASGLGIRLSLNELNTGVHVVNDGGISTHPLLGSFAYQNLQLSRVMLTVAWRSELSCKGFAFPQIQIIQHG